jgi:3-methylcrotonyl-CoA carboxylase alpha subunit
MPGQIISVQASLGANVRQDQPILVLEAMKMEHTLVAPIDGTLADLTLAVGDRVVEGMELFRITRSG